MSVSYRLLVAAERDTWPGRMEAGCRALESELGIELRKAHGGTKNNVTSADVVDRERFFRDRLKTKNRWFSLYRGRDLSFGGTMYGSGQLYMVHVLLPTFSPEQHEKLLVSLGDALEAHSSEYTPQDAWWRLRLAHFRSPLGGAPSFVEQLPDITEEERKLPPIRESMYEGLQEYQPHNFGWVNYWSKAVCMHVGFPERAAGLPMRELSYETPRGACLVKLTPTPLEVRNDAQVAVLRAAYEAFPNVGIRVAARPN